MVSFRSSVGQQHSTVNREVAGSNPAESENNILLIKILFKNLLKDILNQYKTK